MKVTRKPSFHIYQVALFLRDQPVLLLEPCHQGWVVQAKGGGVNFEAMEHGLRPMPALDAKRMRWWRRVLGELRHWPSEAEEDAAAHAAGMLWKEAEWCGAACYASCGSTCPGASLCVRAWLNTPRIFGGRR